jgi:hypothetical protein
LGRSSACLGAGRDWKGQGGGRLEGPQKPPPEPAGGRTFFEIFCGSGPIRSPALSLIDCNHWNFCDDPLCDDLLTMGVDNPECGGL